MFTVTDIMDVSLGFLAVAVSPALPDLPPGSAVPVIVTTPVGSYLKADGILEYTKRPPIKPVLLRFPGLSKLDIPVGSQLAIVGTSGNG